MPARSILSKHIPHLPPGQFRPLSLVIWVSDEGRLRAQRAARLILQSRLNRTEVIE